MQDFIPRKIDINQSIDTITVKQFDHLSRFLHFRIIDEDLSENGEKLPLNLSMCRARLYVEAGDESCAFIDGEIADGEDGIVTFLLPNGITQTAGDFRCEIWLSDPEEHSIISSKIFNLRVEESLRKDSEIEATDQFSVLANALQFVDAAELRISALESSSIRLDGYKMDGTFHVKPLYIGDINGWANGHAYSYEKLLFEGNFNNINDNYLIRQMWGLRNDTSTDFYAWINLLNKAGIGRVTDDELVALAKEAMQFSYSPYSHFRVGAALLAKNGRVFTGCNIENASYGVTNCAERTALFKAVSEGVLEFTTIAITAEKTMAWPCGVCRQALNEFAPDLRVIVACGDERVEAPLYELLPHSFGPNSGTLEVLGKE